MGADGQGRSRYGSARTRGCLRSSVGWHAEEMISKADRRLEAMGGEWSMRCFCRSQC